MQTLGLTDKLYQLINKMKKILFKNKVIGLVSDSPTEVKKVIQSHHNKNNSIPIVVKEIKVVNGNKITAEVLEAESNSKVINRVLHFYEWQEC